MLDDCEQRSERMSEWEASFCDSLKQQIAQGRAPSPKQIDVLVGPHDVPSAAADVRDGRRKGCAATRPAAHARRVAPT